MWIYDKKKKKVFLIVIWLITKMTPKRNISITLNFWELWLDWTNWSECLSMIKVGSGNHELRQAKCCQYQHMNFRPTKWRLLKQMS